MISLLQWNLLTELLFSVCGAPGFRGTQFRSHWPIIFDAKPFNTLKYELFRKLNFTMHIFKLKITEFFNFVHRPEF
jgi:hypothetical protein